MGKAGAQKAAAVEAKKNLQQVKTLLCQGWCCSHLGCSAAHKQQRSSSCWSSLLLRAAPSHNWLHSLASPLLVPCVFLLCCKTSENSNI